MDNLREIVVVDQADNLVGLPYASGRTDVGPEDTIDASIELVDLLVETIQEKKKKDLVVPLMMKRMICHNVEDYHAYNFSQFFVNEEKEITKQMERLERKRNDHRDHCWDMETAALFWRASQFGLHAATVLQNLLKTPGTSPYEGEHGKLSLAMESTFYLTIFETLLAFSPKVTPIPGQLATPIPRSLRRFSSNDYVGVEEHLQSNSERNKLI
jgi:hypothetical protein